MTKQKKLYAVILVIFIVLSLFSWTSFEYLKTQRSELTAQKYLEQTKFTKQELSNLIYQKQKSTVAIALTMANNTALSQSVAQKEIADDYYLKLIENYKEHTLYKNIWVQILDKNATSLYRSWSSKKGDNLLNIRDDVREVVESKKVLSSISVGKFDLSIKAIVPIFHDKVFVGIVETISHFNSIANQLSFHDINSVVILKKEYTKRIENPFTKMFLDDYYIANYNALEKYQQYLKKNGIENYFNDSYKIENGYLIISYPLKNIHSEVIAYFIMFKKIDSIKNLDLDFQMFKGMAFVIITIMTIAVIISSFLYYKNQRERKYYKKILNSSKTIILVNDKTKLLFANKMFFQYFKNYKNIEEFFKEHKCLCDFFIEEDGYIGKVVDGLSWVDYLVKHNTQDHKVKIILDNVEYYFSISASMITHDTQHYSIVLSDITQAERYKHELEKLTVTDTLTGIGNRRYFHQKLQEEIVRAKRSDNTFSVIMFDIDHFKDVNDKYGHDVGDEVLKEYTKLIASFLRETDIFCRIGGEEFMIILPNAIKEDALMIAEKFRSEVETCAKVVPITMSFGVTQYIKGEDTEFIFKRVDNALYKAKKDGRNVVYG